MKHITFETQSYLVIQMNESIRLEQLSREHVIHITARSYNNFVFVHIDDYDDSKCRQVVYKFKCLNFETLMYQKALMLINRALNQDYIDATDACNIYNIIEEDIEELLEDYFEHVID